MSQPWDEFSKSLAEESVPRRESLRRLGLVLAGAVLSPLGMDTAWAARRTDDLCNSFCSCGKKSQRNQCLAACRACDNNPNRMCGGCGNYVCCGNGTVCCGDYCADLEGDPYNCGACGYECEQPGPWEMSACMFGECFYVCAEGAVDCGDGCAFLDSDFANCGACGYACDEPGSYEYGACIDGECQYACAEGAVRCDGACTYLEWDPDNCGACGRVCGGPVPYCSQGECAECPPLPYVALCNGVCVNLLSDSGNCGACGNVCPDGFACSSGACVDPVCQFYEC